MAPSALTSTPQTRKKVVLAYSGGLDTTVILHWLVAKGYAVVAYLLDIGQKVENIDEIGARARRVGAVDFVAVNAREEFLKDYFLPCLQGHAVYEGRYLLGTSIARPLIAKYQVKVAHDTGAQAVAHGATGKGNDQVRFELGYAALDPALEVIAPWKDPEYLAAFPDGRQSMLAYVQKHDLAVKASVARPWSSDDNMIHISYEAGLLEDPWISAPTDIFERMVHPTKAPDQLERCIITWDEGVPVAVHTAVAKTSSRHGLAVDLFDTGTQLASGFVQTFAWIDAAAARHGVGSLGMVESRYVGLKSRGEYHAPGHTALLAAHRDLEGLCLTGSLILEKEKRAPDLAAMVYNGYWFDPACAAMRAFVAATQKHVSGQTRLAFYKGNVLIEGRRSPFSLYDPDLASMDQAGGYKQEHATGFIKLHGLPLAVRRVKQGLPD